MPKIPGIDYNENRVPGPVETSLVTPEQRGAAVGHGMQQLGVSLQNLTNTVYDVYQDSVAAKVTTQAQKRLQDFAISLKSGSIDPDTGEKLAPPPPEDHEDLYNKEVEKVRQEAEGKLGGRGLQSFSQDFNNFSMRHGLVVKENALHAYNAEIQANSDEALQQDAVNFVDADALTKGSIQAAAFDRIDRLQKAGVYTPQEALARRRQFTDDASVGSIIKMMKSSSTGPDDVVRAIDSGEFHDLPADKQQHWRSRAIEEGDRNLRRQIMDEEHQESKRRRDEHETQQGTFKDLYTDLINKKLTPGQVIENEENLSPEHYKILLDATSGRGTTHSDPHILSNLLVRASKGEDVVNEATGAAAHGLLTADDMKGIINHVDHEGVALESANVYKTGKGYIHETMKDIPGVPNPAQQVNRANALREWTDWVKTHPKATVEEGRKISENIVHSYNLVNFDQTSIGTRLPRFLDGGRMDLSPDAPGAFDKLQRAWKATEAAHDAGQIDDQEYRSEMETFTRWGVLIPKPAATPTPTK